MNRSFLLLLAALLLSVFSLNAQQIKTDMQVWPEIQSQMRPWTRWWWMGSAVDEKNLGIALDTYAKAGIGGVEITPIYGVKGFEDRYLDFLSPKWMTMLDYTLQKAGSLGMGVDMNTGTGWPFGGPQIDLEAAASKYMIQQYQIPKGSSLPELLVLQESGAKKVALSQGTTNSPSQGTSQHSSPKATTYGKLQALTAYGKNGQVINLLDKVDEQGKLNWKAADSDYELYALFLGKTLQKVKRAAPAGEGYTLDHLDRQAVNTYLNRFDQAFAGRPVGVRSFFNDSYEVYGANWTPTFLEEFKRLKGYDLALHLRELNSKDSTSAELGRLKSDYRETMSKLLQDNFTSNWTNWAHRKKAITRNQSHGSPGNLLDLYAAVDIPETETFGSSYFPIPGLRRDSADVRNVDPDPMMSKFASSAAHTQGKTLVSSETFTWLTEHFKTSFSQAKPEAEELFLSGINHIFYHGTTYTPAEVPFPGWLFYASTNMVPANSLWSQLKGMNDYFSRCQSMLQSGKADNELLIYWPVYDQWDKPKGMDMPMKVHDVDVWLHPTEFYKQSLKLQAKGYSFDFASDQILSQASVTAEGVVQTNSAAGLYRSIIIPQCRLMPLETLKQIVHLARQGATVIFQNLPEDVPGLAKLEQNRTELKQLLAGLQFKESSTATPFKGKRQGLQEATVGKGKVVLANDLPQALTVHQIEGEQLVNSGLKFIRRKLPEGYSYYLVNHTAKAIDAWLPVNYAASDMLLMDALTGDYGLAATRNKEGKTQVRVQLKSGETIFLKTAVTNSIAAVTATNSSITAAAPSSGSSVSATVSSSNSNVPAAATSARSDVSAAVTSTNSSIPAAAPLSSAVKTSTAIPSKNPIKKHQQASLKWLYLSTVKEKINLDKGWTLHFSEGGPELPADQKLDQLQSWTLAEDPAAKSFSGTGVYFTSFNLATKAADEYILDLGQVNETAHVWINGKDAGYIWSIPYEKRIGKYLNKGKNTIRVEVANLMANRIIDLDKRGISWRNYHEINFVNINYKPFDASGWLPMPSGLLGPVVIRSYGK